MEHPDAKKHLQISILKSVLRIVASTALIFNGFSVAITVAGAFLLLAEILGIAEELV